MSFPEDFGGLVPASPADEIRWDAVSRLIGPACFADMDKTPQNPAFHGEGSVLVHTRMVCRELAGMPLFHRLDSGKRTALFLAAVLHDLGKVKTTRPENGILVSPHHASSGSRMVRELLWREFGLCGRPDLISFRETVCSLVRWHMFPLRLMEREDAERKIRKIAAAGELAADFSWSLLCALAEADMRGRVADDVAEGLERVELARMAAEDAGCLDGPYRFADGFTKLAWLSGRNVQPDQPLFDDSWGAVIMLSGLPGTGKDTWIRENCPGYPVVSLDDIRAELKTGPEDGQGRVVQLARERARAYLRKRQPFVWNATCLTEETRGKLTRLFGQYGARVRIVWLETDWNTRAERNRNRKNAVPEAVVDRMLGMAVPPFPDEAQTVEWICV